jgi:outer membrane lipoprotein-sorting protein
MIKAKDRTRLLSLSMVVTLGIGLMLGGTGCSGISGFRSVGTERPSLMSFWDRSAQASPTPENDSYVLSMRAGQARNAALAKRDSNNTSDSPATDDSGSDTRVANAADSDHLASDGRPGNSSGPQNTAVRVSLGRPEPLPGLARAAAAAAATRTAAATKGSNSAWKSEDGAARPNDQLAVAETPIRAKSRLPEKSKADQGDAPTPDGAAILAKAEDRLKALKTYQMKVTRTERVGSQLQPEEEIILSIRREPKAVRLEWASGPSKGREVIYSSSVDPRNLFVHMPSNAIPLPVMKISVDSPMITRNSRHSITEAGLETIIENLRKGDGAGNKAASSGGVLKYLGTKKPQSFDRLCHQFERKTPTGEVWSVWLDDQTFLPRVVVASDSHGQLIERYVYRDIQENPADLAVAGAFEPDKRWGESKGLLSRFARAAAGSDLPGTPGSTTR